MELSRFYYLTRICQHESKISNYLPFATEDQLTRTPLAGSALAMNLKCLKLAANIPLSSTDAPLGLQHAPAHAEA